MALFFGSSKSKITTEEGTFCSRIEPVKDEWDLIADASAKGTYKEKYSLGYTIPLTLSDCNGTQCTVNMILAAFDHDDLNDESGKAKMTFIADKTIKVGKFEASSNDWCYWGGLLCGARTNCNNIIFDSLPSNLQNYIKPAKKKSQRSSGALVTTSDKIWIPSATEIKTSSLHPSYMNIVSGQGDVYSHLFNDKTASLIKYDAYNNNRSVWVTRTRNTSSNTGYCIAVTADGVVINNQHSNDYIFNSLICFCI